MKKITLYNVIDIRTNKFYTVAIVSERLARFFVPFAEEVQAESSAE